jgi:pepF/M3 family oligoendopeptidase
MPMIQNTALYNPDPAIRKRAAEAEVAVWATMREPLTAALNGVMGTKIILAKRRGRKDVLQAALDQARIDHVTLDAMLDSVRDALPTFRVFLKAKAKMLGKESLAWWDMEASIGEVARLFTFQEARELITSQFETFSPRMRAFADHAFECNWIDAEPRAGKQGGAYCTSVPGAGIIRVLCNFDGSLMQVTAIAHELGHAYHENCQTGKTRQQCVSPMTLNETASLFCESLVTEQAITSASSPQEELSLLNTFLGSAATLNIVTCLSLYDFEKEAFERRDQSELSADEVCEIIRRHQAKLYGDGVDSSHLHPYFWASIPHLFMPGISYYNFPYTFGMLFSLGLYAQYKQRGAAFAADFESLLASTGEFTPLELAARFGIDLRERGFWQASLGLIEKRILRFQQLCSMPKEQ